MCDQYDFGSATKGPVLPSRGKTRITMMLDDDVIEAFRRRAEAAGHGYQTEINRVLREYLAGDGQPLTLEALRQIIREELRAA